MGAPHVTTPHFETLGDVQAYLAQFTDFEKMARFTMKRDTFDLERVERFLNALAAPQSAFEIVHVAGTKGKGSVTTILDALLLGQGLSSGRYTSPHLQRLNERIHINGRDISDQGLCAAFNEMASQLEFFQARGDQLTFFELLNSAAYVAMRQDGVAYSVIETGLGGRLDSTNVCMPAITVITNIGHDHHDKLGDELTDIAYEKAGIIKP
ncbi:MAG: hypothetical protein KDB07_04745, partial [Planctomycetes bacterium]|nr:hypothetical protein [Planctomycetota bacterium]